MPGQSGYPSQGGAPGPGGYPSQGGAPGQGGFPSQGRAPGPSGIQDARASRTACPSCGFANDPGARFCRNCGLPLGWPQDPVRGTARRQPDLPSERGAGFGSVVGLIAAVLVLIVAGVLVLRPLGGGGAGTIGTSFSPGPSASAPLIAESPGTSPLPSPLASGPVSSIVPGASPSEGPSGPPASFRPTTGYTCDTATLADPTNGRWRVTHLTWARHIAYDEAAVTLTRDSDTLVGPTLTIESLSPADLNSTYGITPPADGQREVVVTFDRNARTGTTTRSTPRLQTIRSIVVAQGSDSLLHVVLGVNGTGCHAVRVPAWASDPTASSVIVFIDVKH
jgi:hypothetical protein